MPTNFPTSLDALTNPAVTDSMRTVSHAAVESNQNDAIEALQTKVGVNSSAVATTIDYLLRNALSVDPGHKHTIAAVNGLQAALDASAALSHTHPISEITNLQSSLDGKAASVHTHAISDTTGLQTALDGKAASSHTHAIADTTGLQTALDGKAAASHTHNASDINAGTLPVARGGTGGATASAARTALGLTIGADVQAYDADLAAIAALTGSANQVLGKNAANNGYEHKTIAADAGIRITHYPAVMTIESIRPATATVATTGEQVDFEDTQEAMDFTHSEGGGDVLIKTDRIVVPEQNPPSGCGYVKCGLKLYSDVILRGAGRKATILTAAAIPAGAGESYFTMLTNADTSSAGNSYITVMHIGFELPAPRETATGMERYDAIAEFLGVSHATFFDCWGKNGGIVFKPTADTVNTSGVLTNGKNKNNVVMACHFEQVTGSMSFFQGTDSWFINNLIDKAWDDAFLIGSAGAGHRIMGNRIDNGAVVTNKGAASACIFLNNDGGAGSSMEYMRDIWVENNYLENASTLNSGARAGIYMTGAARNIKLRDNTPTNCVTGIACIDGDRKNVTISGNSPHSNTGNGIKVQANVSSGVVKGVKVHDNDVWDNVGSGIDIYSNGTLEVELQNNRVFDDALSTQTTSLNVGTESGKTSKVRAFNNEFLNATPVNTYGDGLSSGSKLRNNDGYVTETSGIGSIASGATSAVITHGLSTTPAAKNITVTLTESPTNDPSNIWISNLTSTQFTVNCRNDPGASNLDFSWQAIVI
jgi:hypothetical protein